MVSFVSFGKLCIFIPKYYTHAPKVTDLHREGSHFTSCVLAWNISDFYFLIGTFLLLTRNLYIATRGTYT